MLAYTYIKQGKFELIGADVVLKWQEGAAIHFASGMGMFAP